MNKTATGKPQLATVGDMAPGVESTLTRLGEIILGKDHQLQLAMACLVARGHLLIEHLRALARSFVRFGLKNPTHYRLLTQPRDPSSQVPRSQLRARCANR